MSASTVRDLTVDLSSRRDFRGCFDKAYRVNHFDHKQNHHPSFGMISFFVSIDRFRYPYSQLDVSLTPRSLGERGQPR